MKALSLRCAAHLQTRAVGFCPCSACAPTEDESSTTQPLSMLAVLDGNAKGFYSGEVCDAENRRPPPLPWKLRTFRPS